MRRSAARALVLAVAAAGVLLLGTGSAGAYNFTLTFAYVSSANGVVLEPWAAGGPMDVSAPITAGQWTVVVEDAGGLAPAPAFSLTGPGVNLSTTLGGGSETSASFTVSLQPTSTYTFQDGNGVLALAGEAGAGQAAVSFTTSATTESELEANATATPPTTTTGAAPKPPTTPIGPLSLGMSRAGVLALTAGGKQVTTLPAGHYVLTMPQPGRVGTLELRELGGATILLTSAGHRRSRSITLVPGNWTFLSRGHGSVRFIVEPAWAG